MRFIIQKYRPFELNHSDTASIPVVQGLAGLIEYNKGYYIELY